MENVKKKVNFEELKEANQEYLQYKYHKKMLDEYNDEDGNYLSVKIDPNDRLSNLNVLRKEFKDANIKIDENGDQYFKEEPLFLSPAGNDMIYFHESGVADLEINLILKDVLSDIYDVVKYEKEVENKELVDTQAIPLLNELCNVYHRYNDVDYNKTLAKIASLSSNSEEMERLYQKSHESKIFNSPLLGHKKYLLDELFMSNEVYNEFNETIKGEFKNTFYNEITDKAHMISTSPSKLKNEESQFLLDIIQDQRFKDIDASKHGGLVNYGLVLDKAFDRLKKEQGEDFKPYFVQFNALVKMGVLENIVQYNNYSKSLEGSLGRLNNAFYWGSNDPETEKFGDELTEKARKYVDKILENKKIDDELNQAPEKSVTPFRFRP